MLENVLGRFPEMRQDILRLIEEDAVFQEVCGDHEELTSWLAIACGNAKVLPVQIDEARNLLEELQAEILETLEERVGSDVPRNPSVESDYT